ncbi:hypothetical protein Nepgr_018026 [Nepenthes gracilis]|uniref:Uncharacterized protein n=1 Tax=Nepenthes gracilis TaxID=150966 RepID=A0AAD3XTY5_NEPGR|nr:hypothetical protein Nepgr_018026 [Nepenthes gracilis]
MQLKTSAWQIISRHQQQQKKAQMLITAFQGSTKHCNYSCLSTQYKTNTEVGNRRNVSPPSSVILSKGASSQPWAYSSRQGYSNQAMQRWDPAADQYGQQLTSRAK